MLNELRKTSVSLFTKGVIEFFFWSILGIFVVDFLNLPDFLYLSFVLFGLLRFAYWDWRETQEEKVKN